MTALLCHGLLHEENVVLPWDNETDKGDLDQWWCRSLSEQERTLDDFPLPVKQTWVGTSRILAVPSSVIELKNTIRVFDPEQLQVSWEDFTAFIAFCMEFGLSDNPHLYMRWILVAD